MLLYTHVVTALKVKESLGLAIADEGAYLLGSILPDVRYLAGIPRRQTHITIDQFISLARKIPETERDLVSGYLVHLAADELNNTYVNRKFLPNSTRFIIRPSKIAIMNIVMEFAYQKESHAVAPLCRDAGRLGEMLGLPADKVTELAQLADIYINRPTLEHAITTMTESASKPHRNLKFYLNAGRLINRFGHMRRLLVSRVEQIKDETEKILALRCNDYLERLKFLDRE